jgi:hypothetical protein
MLYAKYATQAGDGPASYMEDDHIGQIIVRNVISRSPDWKSIRFTSWSGALALYDSEPPLAQRNNKSGAHRGTRTNIHRAHSAPTNPSD